MGRHKKTTEQFIEQSRKVHGDKYDYSLVEYNGNHSVVEIVCLEHGSFFKSPSHHLKGQGCSKCSFKRLSKNSLSNTKEFVVKAKEVHGDRYDYSLVSYKNSKERVCIVCSKHGIFEQKPSHHLLGKGCKLCSNEKASYYNKNWLDVNSDMHNTSVKIYLVEMYSDSEKFLKLGITKYNVTDRYGCKNKTGGYLYTTIVEKDISMKEAILLEEGVKDTFRSRRYVPENKFNGWTECYTYDSYEELKSLFKRRNIHESICTTSFNHW